MLDGQLPSQFPEVAGQSGLRDFWRITSTCNSKTFVPSSAFRRRKPLEQLEAGTSWRRARSRPSSVGHPRSSTMPGHTLFSTRTEANSGFLTSSDTCHGTRTHQGFSEELAVSACGNLHVIRSRTHSASATAPGRQPVTCQQPAVEPRHRQARLLGPGNRQARAVCRTSRFRRGPTSEGRQPP